MALSSRELYLILRAKNEATGALNAMSRDLDKARSSAALMGAESTRAHLMAEQAAARNAKAHAEYALRQLESERATAQQAVATEQATQRMLGWNTAQLQGQKAAQQNQLAITEQAQAMDRNAVAALQNAKAHNMVQIEQARSVQGAGQHVLALRQQNTALQEQIVNIRDGITARQNEVNSQRAQIDATQQQINTSKQHQQVAAQNLLVAQNAARAYDDQIRSQRDVVSGMRLDIAERQNQINAVNREMDAIRQSNATREIQNQRLRDTGRSMMDAGTAMTAGGALVLAGVYQLTQAAVDYEKQTAMTMTQVRGTGTTLKELGDIGLDVARNFGVSFDDIQAALWDIFSSTNATVPQATTLLNNFAKAAVAGSTDIKTAGTTVIGVLNAWNRPMSDTTAILDAQFKVIQLGKISYEELNKTVGRSIPSAVHAGQSFEELGGMIAFMTSRSATAAQAVTSAGRAMDLFANPKVGERLQAMGISARDASGNFRPLSDVVVELQQKLSKLDPETRAKEIDALFKGSGNNIQARRFWDLVLASDEGAKSFKSMVEQVQNSGGSLETAYGTMADTIAVRNEKMKNNWKALAITLGTELFPAIEDISNGLIKMAEGFERLSPGQKEFLAWAVVIGAVLSVAAGFTLLFVGALSLVAGVIGVGVGALTLIVGAVFAFIAAWVYAYNTVGWFHDAVNWWFSHLWGVIVWFVTGWVGAIANLIEAFKNWGKAFADTLSGIGNSLSTFWAWFTTGWAANFNAVQSQIAAFWAWVQNAWNVAVNTVKTVMQGFWAWLQVSASGPLGALQGVLSSFWSWFTSGWGNVFNSARSVISAFWAWVQVAFSSAVGQLRNLVTSFWSWFTSGWSNTFNSARTVVQAFWAWATANFSSSINTIRSALSSFWSWFTSGWSQVFASARNAVASGANAILSVIQSLISGIRGAFNGLIGQAFGIGANIINGVRNGVIAAAGGLAAAAAAVVSNALAAARAAVGINSPSKDFALKVGVPISQGMAKGVMDAGGLLNKAVSRVTRNSMYSAASAANLLGMAQSGAMSQLRQVTQTPRDSSGLAPVGGFSGGGGGGGVTVNVYTNEIDPRRNAMMLGMELEKAIG